LPKYPLSEHHAGELRTPGGIPLDEITLDGVLEGGIGMDDLRITAGALELQAEIAEAAGRTQLAENLRRAAELVNVPEDRILAIYEALRPGRADAASLNALAAELERDYAAPRCARLLRDAVE